MEETGECSTFWHSFTAFVVCMFVYVLYAFVPHLVNQHIDHLFSLWAVSIDKHNIASLAARQCAFFS